MTYRWLTDLDVALSNYGVPFVEINDWPTDYVGTGDWRTRGRPASTGEFNPSGILCHHTASPPGTSDEADLNAILWGNGSAPGPISQLYLGRTGVVYLVAAGRANHGGQGIRPNIDNGCADMNAALLGIEAGNAGTGAERWSDELTNTYADVVAALAIHYGWDRYSVFLHATTGPPGGGCNSKIDPAGPWQGQPDLGGGTWDLDVWRQFVVDRATGNHQPPQLGDEMATPIGFITCPAGATGHHADGSEYRVGIDGTTFYVMPGGGLQWMRDPGQLSTKQSVLAQAGLRTDTWSTPVGDPDVFGLLQGAKP
jgi:hypothetical protein